MALPSCNWFSLRLFDVRRGEVFVDCLDALYELPIVVQVRNLVGVSAERRQLIERSLLLDVALVQLDAVFLRELDRQ